MFWSLILLNILMWKRCYELYTTFDESLWLSGSIEIVCMVERRLDFFFLGTRNNPLKRHLIYFYLGMTFLSANFVAWYSCVMWCFILYLKEITHSPIEFILLNIAFPSYSSLPYPSSFCFI